MGAKNCLFVAIEGIDGAGKTTCAKLLAREITAHYYKTPSGIFERLRSQIEIIRNNQARFAFYFGATLYASIQIKKIIAKKPAVCDRYINSTIAYHRALGVELPPSCLNKLPLLSPDLCFYLYAEESICAQRIASRRIISLSDVALEKDRNLQRKIHKEFLKLPMIAFDTSKLSPNDVCAQMLIKIRKR